MGSDLKPWSLELTIHDLAQSGPSASQLAVTSGDASRPTPPLAAQAVSLLKIKRLYIDAELQRDDALTVQRGVALKD